MGNDTVLDTHRVFKILFCLITPSDCENLKALGLRLLGLIRSHSLGFDGCSWRSLVFRSTQTESHLAPKRTGRALEISLKRAPKINRLLDFKFSFTSGYDVLGENKSNEITFKSVVYFMCVSSASRSICTGALGDFVARRAIFRGLRSGQEAGVIDSVLLFARCDGIRCRQMGRGPKVF